jgi:hypothetical protein
MRNRDNIYVEKDLRKNYVINHRITLTHIQTLFDKFWDRINEYLEKFEGLFEAICEFFVDGITMRSTLGYLWAPIREDQWSDETFQHVKRQMLTYLPFLTKTEELSLPPPRNWISDWGLHLLKDYGSPVNYFNYIRQTQGSESADLRIRVYNKDLPKIKDIVLNDALYNLDLYPNAWEHFYSLSPL